MFVISTNVEGSVTETYNFVGFMTRRDLNFLIPFGLFTTNLWTTIESKLNLQRYEMCEFLLTGVTVYTHSTVVDVQVEVLIHARLSLRSGQDTNSTLGVIRVVRFSPENSC